MDGKHRSDRRGRVTDTDEHYVGEHRPYYQKPNVVGTIKRCAREEGQKTDVHFDELPRWAVSLREATGAPLTAHAGQVYLMEQGWPVARVSYVPLSETVRVGKAMQRKLRMTGQTFVSRKAPEPEQQQESREESELPWFAQNALGALGERDLSAQGRVTKGGEGWE